MYTITMIQKKSTFFLGLFIFIIPFLGFPSLWKTVFVVFCGIVLMAMSVKLKLTLPKKPIRSVKRIYNKKIKTSSFVGEEIATDDDLSLQKSPKLEIK